MFNNLYNIPEFYLLIGIVAYSFIMFILVVIFKILVFKEEQEDKTKYIKNIKGTRNEK